MLVYEGGGWLGEVYGFNETEALREDWRIYAPMSNGVLTVRAGRRD